MKTPKRSAFMYFVLALFLSSVALSVFADEPDPPSRAVRLKYTTGAVSVQPGGVNDWVEAVVNRPLTTADRVWTDKDARAELNLGSASMRMNAETSLTLTNVGDEIVQVELDQGTLNLHIRHLFGGETYEIDTPNQAFTILKAGDYRFDVDPNADATSVTVWKGEGEANGQGNGVRVGSREQASFTGGTSLEHRISSAPGLDGFDDWCRVRDNREDNSQSYRYVSADVVGADELDDYGTWRSTGEYGSVWVPRVASGWAPYHDGHWVWVEPWGWTWVDDAPWGYAPSHYGRWVYTGGYWGWAPGPILVERPIYAPALVAWVGGEHFGVSLSFGGGGGVGWFPLGWGEPYVPSYRVSRAYFQNVNVRNTRIVNITNVTNNYYVTNNNTTIVNRNITNIHYANQNVNGAVTAVPRRVMVNSQSVGRAAVRVPAGELRTGTIAMAAPVAPERNSVLGGRGEGRGAGVAPPARVGTARPVFSRAAPPPRPVPFEAKQEQLAKTPGRPLDRQTEAEIRTRVDRESPPARNANAPGQFGRPGAPNGNPAQPNPTPQPGATGRRDNNQPPNTGAPTPAGRPGAQPTPNANAPQPSPAPRPSGPARPGMNQPPNAEAPAQGRNVPRPPQPGMSPTPANPNQPNNAPRAVPRPPQMDRNPGTDNPRQPGRNPNDGREQPSPTAPNEPNVRGSQPVRPPQPTQPEQPSRNNQPNRPETQPTPPQPRRDNSDNARPTPPRPTQPAPTPNVEQPRRESPPRPAQPAPTPNAEQPRREPPPRPQAEPRQEAPRPPAESRPQREGRPPQQQQKSEKPKNEPKHQDKPDKNNFR